VPYSTYRIKGPGLKANFPLLNIANSHSLKFCRKWTSWIARTLSIVRVEHALTKIMASSGMLGRVALERTDVSDERSPSIIRVARIGELGTTLAVTRNRRTLRRSTKYGWFIIGTFLKLLDKRHTHTVAFRFTTPYRLVCVYQNTTTCVKLYLRNKQTVPSTLKLYLS
jgi:hypothetical protein